MHLNYFYFYLLSRPNGYKKRSSTSSCIKQMTKKIKETSEDPMKITRYIRRKYNDVIIPVAQEDLEGKERSKRKIVNKANYYEELSDKQEEEEPSSDFAQEYISNENKKKSKSNKPRKKTYKKSNRMKKKKSKGPHKPIDSSNDQINYFLSWKNQKIKDDNKEIKEFRYKEVDTFDAIDYEQDFIMKDAHAVLISPPWNFCRLSNSLSSNDTNQKFDFSTFQSMQIPFYKMKKGMIFIWTKKEDVERMINYITSYPEIKYVENLVWVHLTKSTVSMSNTDSYNRNNAKSFKKKRSPTIDSNQNLNIIKQEDIDSINSDQYSQKEYENDDDDDDDENVYFASNILNKRNSNGGIFSNSFLSLLLFIKRKKGEHVELRHQRTIDTVFDYYNEDDPNYTPRDFIYPMIEVLLPESNNQEGEPLRKIEIFSHKNAARPGWAHLNFLPSNFK